MPHHVHAPREVTPRTWLARQLARPTVPSPEFHEIHQAACKVWCDACEQAPRVGQCGPEEAAETVLRMRALGHNVTVRNYLDWLDGGTTFAKFDRAARLVLAAPKVRDLANLYGDDYALALGPALARLVK